MEPWVSSVLRTLRFAEGLFCLNVVVTMSIIWLHFARPNVDSTALAVTSVCVCLMGAAVLAAMHAKVRRAAEGGEPRQDENADSEGPAGAEDE